MNPVHRGTIVWMRGKKRGRRKKKNKRKSLVASAISVTYRDNGNYCNTVMVQRIISRTILIVKCTG